MRFPLKAVTTCFKEKTKSNCKKNHKCGKLANYWLDIMSKMNFRMLVVILYALLTFGSKKI